MVKIKLDLHALEMYHFSYLSQAGEMFSLDGQVLPSKLRNLIDPIFISPLPHTIYNPS